MCCYSSSPRVWDPRSVDSATSRKSRPGPIKEGNPSSSTVSPIANHFHPHFHVTSKTVRAAGSSLFRGDRGRFGYIGAFVGDLAERLIAYVTLSSIPFPLPTRRDARPAGEFYDAASDGPSDGRGNGFRGGEFDGEAGQGGAAGFLSRVSGAQSPVRRTSRGAVRKLRREGVELRVGRTKGAAAEGGNRWATRGWERGFHVGGGRKGLELSKEFE